MGKIPVLRPTGDDTFVIRYEVTPTNCGSTSAGSACTPAKGADKFPKEVDARTHETGAPSWNMNDDFDFADSLALSRRQEAQKDFEAACNTRLHSFQRLVELVPDEGETILEWEDDNSQAALLTGYCSGIDHFLVGDWEMAAAIFEMLLELDPEDHLAATVPLAYTYLAMEEFDSFDEVINDVNDKRIDKVILTLWSEFLRSGRIAEGELIRLKTRFAPYHAEFIADSHPVSEEYLADIKSENPSKEALARELWLQTEHLWTLFPAFIEKLRDVSVGR